MKLSLKSLRTYIYPVFKLMVLAAIPAFAAISNTLWKQEVQAVSSKAKRGVLLKNREIVTDTPILFPSHQTTMINPDVQLKLTFKDTPRIGTSGKIRIYDAANDRLVDSLDMSIPPGPTKPV